MSAPPRVSDRPAAPAAGPRPESGPVVHDQVAINNRRSLVVIAAFAAVWLVVGLVVCVGLLGLVLGLPIPLMVLLAIVDAAGITAYNVRKVEPNVLDLIDAHPADRQAHARLVNVVDGLCVANGLPEPRLFVVEDPAVNALATRRSPREASIVVTTGLIEALDRMALEAVIAHQLCRIKTDEVGPGTLAATLAAGPVLTADRMIRRGSGLGATLLALAPLRARLIRAVSGEEREAAVDHVAVGMTRYPPGLLAALEACEARGTVVASAVRSSAHLWFAMPLATDASDPFGARNALFDSFAPLSQRIEVMREL